MQDCRYEMVSYRIVLAVININTVGGVDVLLRGCRRTGSK